MMSGFRASSYEGPDSGLMLIGSRSVLEKLIAELTEALRDVPEKEEAKWPRLLCDIPVPNPNGSEWPYAVSIYLETVTAATPSLPAYSRMPGKFQIALWLLAGVGLVSLVKWLTHLFVG